jgi:TonB-dependent SusC/RagA subfamily outer membrane receptor
MSFALIAAASPFTGSITGKVVDKKTGEPLPGANVVVVGTSAGAATGVDGAFTISNLQPRTYTVVVSFVGYRSQTVDVRVVEGEPASISVSMREDVLNMEEVVVTGIASRTSKEVAEVAGSRVGVSNLTATNSYQTVTQLLAGKAAGVNLAASSGNVGSGFRFNVRSGGGLKGDEQPVIYIDGVRVDNDQIVGFGVGGQGMSALNTLNPEEIENIEFLKGPAAASSYGTSGSNGVVLVTTKRGKLRAGSSSGIAIDYKFIGGANKQNFEYSTSDFVSAVDANRLFRSGGLQQHTLSATGGSERLKYFTLFDYRDEDGILRNNFLDRKNMRANIDAFPNDKLAVHVSAGYTLSNIARPNNDNNILGYLGNTLLRPTSYLFTDSIAVEHIFDETRTNRFIGSVGADYTPFKGLTGRFIVGLDDDTRRQDQTFPVNYRYQGVSQLDQGTRRIFNRHVSNYTYTMDGRYEYSLLSSRLKGTAIVGAQLLNRRTQTSQIDRFNFNTELITNIGAGAQLASADEGFENRREAGLFTEHSFSYLDQYYFTFGIRRDYASVIGREAPSINYPKASLAVRLDRYGFFPNVFSLMKVRAAYGESGILPDLLDGIALLWRAESGGPGVGATLNAIGNDAIKPERGKEIELGFEAEVFQNYGIEFTYYRQKFDDSIIGFRNSPSTGKIASPLPFNIGKIEGSGVETLVRANPINSRNFGLDMTLIANYQKNEVIDLGGAQPIFDGFDINVITEGLRKHEFFSRVVTGVVYATSTDPAQQFYSSAALTTDRVALGNPIPSHTGSFSMNIRFLKNFNVYALADWQTDLSLFNFTEVFSRRFGNDPEFNRLATELGLAGTNRAAGVASFSTPVAGVTPLTPGTAEYQAAAEKFARLDHRVNANFVEEADFLKLREVSVSYNFSDLLPKFFAGSYVNNVVLGFSARNLWTTTKYSGADVEVNHNGARSLTRGNDFLTLQQGKTYNFFVNFGL